MKMMKFKGSKRVRALLRQWAETAYERELRELLDELEASFARWRRDEIDTLSLAEEVARFSRGSPRRRLYQRYEATNFLDLNVAQAIVRGIIKAEEVPKELLDALEEAIEFQRNGLADGTIRFEETD